MSGLMRTPSVISRSALGDDTSVRYTSSTSPVCTDGVPMPSVLFGYVEMAGAYVPSTRSPFSTLMSAEYVTFWSEVALCESR